MVMGNFFDYHLKGMNAQPMAEGKLHWIGLVEIIFVSALFYFLTRPKSRIDTRTAIVGGMFINAVASSTWNFINASMFETFPIAIVLPDISWHIVVIGSISGLSVMWLYNRLEMRTDR